MAAKYLLEQYRNNFEVVIVGKGRLESEIRSCLKGLDNYNIIKWQPAEKIHEIYIACFRYLCTSFKI